MKQASEFRTRIKYLIYRFIKPDLADKLRNIYNLKDKFFYDNKLRRQIKTLIQKRNKEIPIEDDLDLLKGLHELFPTYNLSKNYKINNLLESARNRLKYLASFGIELTDKDLVDFGAGHGENLMIVNDFNLKSCTGFDFSDDRYKLHEKQLSPKVLSRVNFNTLDLVTEDIGSENCDIILSFSSFEHFEDPGEVLNRCYKALRAGGVLYAEFAAFNAPFATHRKIFSGVPYVQNIFKDEVAYDFFYNKLKINEGINRYTKEKIINGDPFPEVNRWQIKDYEKVFLDEGNWEIINYRKVYNYQYQWLVNLFKSQMSELSNDDLYADYLKFVLKKK